MTADDGALLEGDDVKCFLKCKLRWIGFFTLRGASLNLQSAYDIQRRLLATATINVSAILLYFLLMARYRINEGA